MTLEGVCGCSGMLCPASEWMGVLASFRPATSQVRLAKICQTLLENGFMQWPMLEHADDPSCWVGADSHDKEDLDLVRSLMRVGKHRPRRVDTLLLHLRMLAGCVCVQVTEASQCSARFGRADTAESSGRCGKRP